MQPNLRLKTPPILKHTTEISRACPPETVPPPCPATLSATQTPPPTACTHPRLKPSGTGSSGEVKGSLSAPISHLPFLKSAPRHKKHSSVSILRWRHFVNQLFWREKYNISSILLGRLWFKVKEVVLNQVSSQPGRQKSGKNWQQERRRRPRILSFRSTKTSWVANRCNL